MMAVTGWFPLKDLPRLIEEAAQLRNSLLRLHGGSPPPLEGQDLPAVPGGVFWMRRLDSQQQCVFDSLQHVGIHLRDGRIQEVSCSILAGPWDFEGANQWVNLRDGTFFAAICPSSSDYISLDDMLSDNCGSKRYYPELHLRPVLVKDDDVDAVFRQRYDLSLREVREADASRLAEIMKVRSAQAELDQWPEPIGIVPLRKKDLRKAVQLEFGRRHPDGIAHGKKKSLFADVQDWVKERHPQDITRSTVLEYLKDCPAGKVRKQAKV